MVNTWPRSSIDFNTDRVTIVCYPWGGGGKFLINCLGLSSRACLQHIELVRRQLIGKCNLEDKKVHLGNAINAVQGRWNDLNLGANVLTGVEEESYIGQDPSTAQYWPWYSGVDRLSRSGLHFFIDTHTLTHLEAILEVWPRANIILINNVDNFLKLRKFNPGYKEFFGYWREIRGNDWPELPPGSWQEFLELPQTVRDELSELFDWEICRFIRPPEVNQIYQQADQRRVQDIRRRYPQNKFIELDGSMYLDWVQTYRGIEQCYSLLELGDIDKEFIAFYYTRWIDTITQTPI